MAATAMPTKPRWADLADQDYGNGEELMLCLPPGKVIGPDKNGIKKVIEYRFNDEGKIVMKTTTSRVRTITIRENKRVLERRSWPKFGGAVHEDVGARLTLTSTEDILLERPKAKGSAAEESRVAGESVAPKGGATLKLCRNCGKKGDHWTARCPYKDSSLVTEATDENGSSSKTSNGSYIPPSRREGAERSSGSDMRRKYDENVVKVSNLSEETGEPDLRELCSVFGPLTRVYIPLDRNNGSNRGFGFVNFVNREDAKTAIQKLDGYGYDNLILRVDWAPARS